MPPEFVPFPKIPRWNREVVISEKLDGTNGVIHISDAYVITAGSRSRWLSPGKQTDNYGVAAWVESNKDELIAKLGPGSHFGEWWGAGIQRGYGLKEKRFSLFNTSRWSDPLTRPACCDAVPVLWAGLMEAAPLPGLLISLIVDGSFAAPGFDKPEGLVIYHTASGQYFKRLIEGDALPKGKVTYGEKIAAAKSPVAPVTE